MTAKTTSPAENFIASLAIPAALNGAIECVDERQAERSNIHAALDRQRARMAAATTALSDAVRLQGEADVKSILENDVTAILENKEVAPLKENPVLKAATEAVRSAEERLEVAKRPIAALESRLAVADGDVAAAFDDLRAEASKYRQAMKVAFIDAVSASLGPLVTVLASACAANAALNFSVGFGGLFDDLLIPNEGGRPALVRGRRVMLIDGTELDLMTSWADISEGQAANKAVMPLGRAESRLRAYQAAEAEGAYAKETGSRQSATPSEATLTRHVYRSLEPRAPTAEFPNETSKPRSVYRSPGSPAPKAAVSNGGL